MNTRFRIHAGMALVSAVLLAVPTAIHAGAGKGDGTAEAKAAYEEGKAHFKAGEYQEAMDEFTAAYNLTAEPNLLFNLAATAERLGENERAIAYYKVYLEEVPDALDAKEVRARIEKLKAPPPAPTEAAQEPAPKTEDATPPPDVDPKTYYDLTVKPEPPKRPVWPKLVVGLGAAVVAGGIITSILAYNEYRGLKNTCKPNCTDDDISTAKGLAIASDLQFGLGGATLVAGVVSLVLTKEKYKREQARFEVLPAGSGLSVRGRF